MQAEKYQWQGEPCKVEFGYTKVKTVLEKPMWWYNYECSLDKLGVALIPSVKISQHGQEFVLANHHGIGVHKLINGGWPNYAHFSLPKTDFVSNLTWDEIQVWVFKSFDLEAYKEHESNRRKWQKLEHPEEFEKHEQLIKAMRNFKKT